MIATEDMFSAFESAIGQPVPMCIQSFYVEFDLSQCPGEFYNIPTDRFANCDRLLIQYIKPISDVSDLQMQSDAIYFCFAASQDELDWWVKIDRHTGYVNVCSTYVGSGPRLADLECYPLTFAELIRCPFRSARDSDRTKP